MHALKHVSSAVDHAERLAEEAEELSAVELAGGLRTEALALSRLLDRALQALDRVSPAREARQRAHQALSDKYAELTFELSARLPAEEASRLSPGSHLDVAERARFRLRRLMARDPSLADLCAELSGALLTYERAVDAFLLAAADAAATRERAVLESQRFRLTLERAKLSLLGRAEVGSEAWRRIKRRAVRTRPAAWLKGAPLRKLAACA